MSDDRSGVGGEVDGDHIKTDGHVLQAVLPGDLRGEGDEAFLLGLIDAAFGVVGIVVSGFDFDHNECVTIGGECKQIDFAVAVAQVAGEDAVALGFEVFFGGVFATVAGALPGTDEAFQSVGQFE